MSLFECKHPARWLGVNTHEVTIEPNKDPEFENHTFHLWCQKCGTPVDINCVVTVGGVEAFLKRLPSKARSDVASGAAAK